MRVTWPEVKRGDVGFALMVVWAVGYSGGFLTAILVLWFIHQS